MGSREDITILRSTGVASEGQSVRHMLAYCRSAFYTIEVLGEATCSLLEDVAALELLQVEPSSPASWASGALSSIHEMASETC